MFWFQHSIRAATVLLVIGLTGCVTAPAYRYTADVGGDYYYDERQVVATSVHVLPTYGAFGYGVPGGWYGSVGFGFGTYYGLGGYYGPSWGAFGPRYGYVDYWRPPYYYKPRYTRPPHYYRPPYRHIRPLPWPHESASAWRRPGQHDRHWDDHRPGNRPWRKSDRMRPARPAIREAPRDMTVQFGPAAPRRRAHPRAFPSASSRHGPPGPRRRSRCA